VGYLRKWPLTIGSYRRRESPGKKLPVLPHDGRLEEQCIVMAMAEAVEVQLNGCFTAHQ
jgi:hypothetical protein